VNFHAAYLTGVALMLIALQETQLLLRVQEHQWAGLPVPVPGWRVRLAVGLLGCAVGGAYWLGRQPWLAYIRQG
jgi:hypothetical protein